jgi:hypothetical protein
MQSITSSASLKNAIQVLKIEQSIKADLLKDEIYLVFETFKPANLLRNALGEGSSMPNLINNLLGITVGIASGFLSRKIFVGSSGNLIRKLLGSVLQFRVANVVAGNPETIKSLGHIILQSLFRKKATKS